MLFAIITFAAIATWIVADIVRYGDDTTTRYFARKADAS